MFSGYYQQMDVQWLLSADGCSVVTISRWMFSGYYQQMDVQWLQSADGCSASGYYQQMFRCSVVTMYASTDWDIATGKHGVTK